MLASEGPDVTFYDFLGVPPSASHDDIVKAQRKKSRTLHPDKIKQSFIAAKSTAKPTKRKPGQKAKPGVHVSKGPSEREVQATVKKATERYQRLTVVANILKGEGRERYDHFLSNGFPTWRGTGYYYKRFRPGLGTVLLGLFLVGGGGAHYGALLLSWKRQREFVDRYIRHARRAAWGDETGIRGIPGLDGSAATGPAPVEEPDSTMHMNRRQKRQMEKEQKKEKPGKGAKSGGRSSGTQTPTGTAAPTGERKRVQAENGKILLVDSIGNVFLEEQDEDGTTQEFLLDLDEIPRPTIRDTALYRFPIWVYGMAVGRLRKSSVGTSFEDEKVAIKSTAPADEEQDSSSSYEILETSGIEQVGNGRTKKRNKKGKK